MLKCMTPDLAHALPNTLTNTFPNAQRLDAISVRHAVCELHTAWMGAKVQKITQHQLNEFSIEVWQGKSTPSTLQNKTVLYLHLNKQNPFFAWLTPSELQSIVEKQTHQSPLWQGLKKILIGSRLEGVSSIEGEPLLELHFKYRNELGFESAVKLVVEIMGKYTNLLLVDASSGKIIQLLHAVDETQSQQRPLHIGAIYSPPPRPLEKIPLAELDFSTVWQVDSPNCSANYSAEQAFQFLKSKAWGVSKALLMPLLKQAQTFEEAGFNLSQWIHQPQGVLLRDEAGHLTGFHGVVIQENTETVPSMSLALSAYYLNWKQRQVWHSASHRLLKPLETKREHVRSTIARLNDSLLNTQTLDALQEKGDILMTLYSMRYFEHPKPFESTLQLLENPLTGEACFPIAVDLKKTWLENAQYYYKQVQKSKGRNRYVESQCQHLASNLAYLDYLATLFENAETLEDLQALEADWQQAGLLKAINGKSSKTSKNSKEEETGILKHMSPDGITIWVGKSAKANGQLISKHLKPKDWWVHVGDGMAGSHVIVKVHGTTWANEERLPDATLEMATALAGWYSQGRLNQKVCVLYTRGKFVRPIPESWAGHVTHSHESSVMIQPQSYK